MWISEGFLYVYVFLFGPTLYLTFRREHGYWLSRPVSWQGARAYQVDASGAHAERLLDAIVACVPPPRNAHKNGARSSASPSQHGASGLVGSSGFADVSSAQMLRTALAGVRVVPRDDLMLHELIGTGGFAEVFRATWLERTCTGGVGGGASGRWSGKWGSVMRIGQAADCDSSGSRTGAGVGVQVALKQLRSLPREPSVLAAFCKEIALMQRLHHPNVLSLLGVTIAPSGALGVLTEYLGRGSVFQMLHSGSSAGANPASPSGVPLPRVLAMRMLGDCARGMSYLHSCSPPIIHRDLKSQNLLVAPDFSVKVADFGLSRECLQAGAMTRVGSVQWAAPEVLLGKPYSHKCDLWSFGVVCWEVLTGRVPFAGMSQTTVATKVALEGMRLPVPPKTPIRLLRLIARCWSEAVELRPSFDELVIELQGVEQTLIDEGAVQQEPTIRVGSAP